MFYIVSVKLIAYFVGCHPTFDKSYEIIKEAIVNGVSVIELGFSNSEASAEGPIIKAAQDRVLQNNITLDDVFLSLSCLISIS